MALAAWFGMRDPCGMQYVLGLDLFRFSGRGARRPQNREACHWRNAELNKVRGLEELQRGVIDLLRQERRQQPRLVEVLQYGGDDLVARGYRLRLRVLVPRLRGRDQAQDAAASEA